MIIEHQKIKKDFQNWKFINLDRDMDFSRFFYDTRAIDENSGIFVPTINNQVNGHEYIEEAFRKGCILSLCQNDYDYSSFVKEGNPLIVVNNISNAILLFMDYLYMPIKESLLLDLPYYSAFANTNLNEAYIKAYVDGSPEDIDNPKWEDFGASQKEEYLKWIYHVCGPTCLKTIFSDIGINMSIYEIVKGCLKYDAISCEETEANGLRYMQCKNYVEGEFDYLKLHPVNIGSLNYFLYELSLGSYVILSVNSKIRTLDSPDKSGGHLIVLTGYDLNKGTVYFHNSSGYVSNKSFENVELSIADFKRFFANKGLVINKK